MQMVCPSATSGQSPSWQALLALRCLAWPCLALPCLALPCLALPGLALPCLALPCLALRFYTQLASLSALSASMFYALLHSSSGFMTDRPALS